MAKEKLIILGNIPVSPILGKMASMTDFDTTLVESNKKYVLEKEDEIFNNINIIDEFKDSMGKLDIDENSYIVIMTREHEYDEIVLEQALRTNAKYIGLMGSKSRKPEIIKWLQDIGFNEQDIEKVHLPIGLKIKGKMPSEIAVSILAELIQVRAS